MVYQILICDDDFLYANYLKTAIEKEFKKYIFHYNLQCCSNSKEILDSFIKFDIAFLDIDMPEIDGFSLSTHLKQINKDIKIIFVTSKNDLVFESFNFRPYDFYRKDLIEIEINFKIKMLIKTCEQRKYLYEYNYIKIEIPFNEIILAYKINNYSFIRTRNKEFKERKNIAKLFSEFNKDNIQFVMIHRSICVNLEHIINIDDKQLTLSTGEKMIISNSKYLEVRNLYSLYCIENR